MSEEVELFKFTPLAANWEPMGEGRSPGLHLSDILYGPLYENRMGKSIMGIEGEQENVRMQMGFMWERAIHWVFKEFMQHQPLDWDLQGEVQKDGIWMTPDGVDKENNCLIECKATWRTLRRWREDPEENFWTWFVQSKSYAHALGMNTCRFVVFWVNGDYTYKQGKGPQVTVTKFKWTDAELEDNWAEVLAHAKLVKGN